MFSKRIIPITVIFLAFVFGFYRFQKPCGENVDSTYQNGWQGSFQVKVDRKPEACGFAPALAGADYIFSSKPENSENWQEIMTIRYADPIDFPRENMHIFDENTAAVFMLHKYAVTSDKGKTWIVWDIDKDLGLEKYTKVRSISRINFGENGFVTMSIDVVTDNGRRIDAPFFTHDFGKTWEVLGK